MRPAPRPTPYDLVFGEDAFDAGAFERLREEVESRGAATVGELLALPAGGAILRDLVPEGSGPEHRAVMAEVGGVLFHAFRYWLHGRRTWYVGEKALHALLDAPAAAWTPRTPHPAGYVQLARNTVWARADEAVPPEPVDGFFWSSPAEAEGARGERLDLLFALGVRPGRPGFTVVTVSLEPGTDLATWTDVRARPDGEDFANVLPGGELQGYRAVTTHAEAVKLALRTFRHIDVAGAELVEGVHVVNDG